MPCKPAPLIVEAVYGEDKQSDREARLDALELLIDWVLEDRAGDTGQLDLIA